MTTILSPMQNKSSTPLISIIVPNFNEEQKLLFESLYSLKNQTYSNFEVIIVDESTELGLADFCKQQCNSDCRFIYIRPEQRLGLAASLNLGLQKASGIYIARFDSDDICHLSRFEKQVEFLEENKDIDIVGSWIDVINEKKDTIYKRKYPISHAEITRKFIFSSAIAHPSVMFRKALINSGDFFYDPSFKYCEDLELWLRLLRKGARFANIPESLVFYRQEDSVRPGNHWMFNYKARKKNLVAPNYIWKFTVMNLILLWSLVPSWAQRVIYKRITLKD